MRLTIERVRALLAAATPGSWKLEAGDRLGWLFVLDERGHQVADAVGRSPKHDPAMREVADVQRGNAALIAAAPDLAANLLDAHAALATERERAEAAEAECARLREAMRRQSAAVRMASTARATIDAHDQATLRSLAGQDRAALIEEIAAARRERDDWNARATELESERDEARAETAALRAIVEGRTVAPTDAEIAAHAGEWRCVGAGAAYAEISGLVAAGLRDVARGVTLRWWPLDATGRPCSWPEVQP